MVCAIVSASVLQIMAYFAQTERESIHQRQAEGIAAAKAKGNRLGRPPRPLPDRIEEICGLCQCGALTTREAAVTLGMSHTTFFRHFLAWAQNKSVSEGRLSETDML